MSTDNKIVSPKKKIETLKAVLNAPSVQEQFNNALKENSAAFTASIIDLYNSDDNMQKCEPNKVVMEALKAATLKLPINKALGFAYIVAYGGNPTFQLGYKGYIQLALRTGFYSTINADIAYEGEVRMVDKLTGEVAFDGVRKSDKVEGYFCYFRLLNGFSKTLYMTVKEMAKHAKKYSKSIPKEKKVEDLILLANIELSYNSVGWLGNFNSMGLKTVVRLLLSKYGYLSIEMQTAFTQDDDEPSDGKIGQMASTANTEHIDADEVDYEDLGKTEGNKEADDKPSYA